MPKPPRVLFLCTGNSARSQMAEGFARYYGANKLHVESAGLSPKGLNPVAAWVMYEAGVDVRHQPSRSLSDAKIEHFDCVVTLCGDARDSCPALPAGVRLEHWPLTDPAAFRGTIAEKREAFRLSRNEIENRVKNLLRDLLGSKG